MERYLKKLSPYPEINEVLLFLTQEMQKILILGEKLIGLYLTGSIIHGCFNLESSDIEIIAILNCSLDMLEIAKIKEMHEKITKNYNKWSKRIKCSYITMEMLEEFPTLKQPKTSSLGFIQGRIQPFQFGNEWTTHLYILYEKGIPLLGPDPKRVLKPISIEAVRKATLQNLFEKWTPSIRKAK